MIPFKKKILVIIPVHNQYQYTITALRCIRRATEQSGADIKTLIIDNASDKPFPQQMGNVSIIRNEKNLLFAKAINQGLKTVEDEDILVLNNDVMLTSSFFDRMVDGLIAGYDLVGPITNNCAGVQNQGYMTDKRCIFEYPFSGNQCTLNAIEIEMMSKFEKKFLDVQWLNGFCLFISNKAFREVGFFDEEFPLSGEEIDYCYRAYDKGFKLGVNRHSFVWHFKGQTVKMHPELKKYWEISANKLRKKYKNRFPRQVL